MAHDLTISPLGTAEMFYVRESPWHGLGTKLQNVATGKDAIVAAHLGWTVELQPLYLQSRRVVPDRWATVRGDTGAPLGVVGRVYRPIQNHDAFAFIDALVGEARAIYHTAGSLRGGQKVWVQAKLPEDLVIVPGDAANKFLLLVNSHDGTGAMICRFVATRVVCQNTLRAALREHGAEHQVSVRHTRGARERVAEARRLLGTSERYFDVFGQQCEAMSAKQLSARLLTEYLGAVFPLPRNGEDPTKVKRIHEALEFLFEQGQGNQLRAVRGTLWAAYNGVAEYVDHVRGVRPNGTLRSSWAESALFGPGDQIKKQAFDAAVGLLKEGTFSRALRRLRNGSRHSSL